VSFDGQWAHDLPPFFDTTINPWPESRRNMGVKLNVLDPESTGSAYLGEKLQEAFEEIAKERRFDEVTVDDIRLIAAGSGEWRQVD